MTDATAAYGTLLKRGDGAVSEAFSAVAEVTKISGPKLKLDALDVTHMESTEGWREFVGGLLEGGEVGFDVNFLPANATQNAAAGLLLDLKNRTKRNFQIVFPDTSDTTWSFTALVTGCEVDASVEDKLSASLTLQITGKPTLA